MKIKRKCVNCNSPEHMTRLVDKEFEVYDVRHRICFKCHAELDSSAINNSGESGGLKAMRSESMGLGDIYCESFTDVSPDAETDQEGELVEKYADDETEISLEDEAI